MEGLYVFLHDSVNLPCWYSALLPGFVRILTFVPQIASSLTSRHQGIFQSALRSASISNLFPRQGMEVESAAVCYCLGMAESCLD